LKTNRFNFKENFVIDYTDSGCGGMDCGHYDYEIFDKENYVCTVPNLEEANNLCILLNKLSKNK